MTACEPASADSNCREASPAGEDHPQRIPKAAAMGKGVGRSAMTERSTVRDPQRERHDIHIGEERNGAEDAAPQRCRQSSRRLRQARRGQPDRQVPDARH